MRIVLRPIFTRFLKFFKNILEAPQNLTKRLVTVDVLLFDVLLFSKFCNFDVLLFDVLLFSNFCSSRRFVFSTFSSSQCFVFSMFSYSKFCYFLTFSSCRRFVIQRFDNWRFDNRHFVPTTFDWRQIIQWASS